MKKLFFLFVVSNLLPLKISNINRLNGTSISKQQIDLKVQELMDSAQVSGIAISIFNNDTVAYQKAHGYANKETGEPLETDHIFYGASLSKSVFGYIVAHLVQEQKLDLDKPLQEYLDVEIPDLEVDRERLHLRNLKGDLRYRDITARMCLNHSTGFPNWRWLTREGNFTKTGELQIYFDPGTDYGYSGEGMMLLQYVIERITQKGLETLAQAYVFQPLEMHNTSYIWQDRFKEHFCYGHDSNENKIPKDTNDEAGAAGSMETTPEDYSKFMGHILKLCSINSPITKLMFEPSIRIKSKKQFGPESLIKSDANDNIQLSYGMGWGIFYTPYGIGVFKEGHDEGWGHYSVLFPEKNMGVLLMSNSHNGEGIFKELLELTIANTYTPWEWELYFPWDYNADK